MEIIKKYWLVVLLALLLRIFLSWSTFHPDIRHFDMAGQIFAKGYILNLYDYKSLANDSLVMINQSNPLNYPPLIYILNGLFSSIFSLFVPQSLILEFLSSTSNVLGNWQVNLHLLLLKLPYLFFDFGIAFYLVKFFDSFKDKKIALFVWLFNPVNLYSTYMLGQFDIIPVMFILISLFYWKVNKITFSSLALGFGIAFKIFPIFLLVPLALTQSTWKNRLKVCLLGVVPYLLTILPFLPSIEFRETALLASQTDKSFYAKILVSGGEAIFLFPTTLVFLYLILLYQKQKLQLWVGFFVALLPFFIFTHYHPQWFLWLTPFLIIDLIKSNLKHWLLAVLVFISWLVSLFFFDPSLTVGLFAPLFPPLFNLPSIWQLIGLSLNYDYIRSLTQTLLAGVLVYYLYIYLHPQTND